jgi:hypothetical protein
MKIQDAIRRLKGFWDTCTNPQDPDARKAMEQALSDSPAFYRPSKKEGMHND